MFPYSPQSARALCVLREEHRDFFKFFLRALCDLSGENFMLCPIPSPAMPFSHTDRIPSDGSTRRADRHRSRG